jgi:hypothetical protein
MPGLPRPLHTHPEPSSVGGARCQDCPAPFLLTLSLVQWAGQDAMTAPPPSPRLARGLLGSRMDSALPVRDIALSPDVKLNLFITRHFY